MRIFPRRLGPKLNLSLLVFLLLLGAATASIVFLGFQRTQDDAQQRSRAALEDQGKLALQAVAGGAAEQGGVLFESAAETGRRAAGYLDSDGVGARPSLEQPRFAVSGTGVLYDPNPNRASDLVLLNGASADNPAVQNDIAFSAALDNIAPVLLKSVTGEGGDPNFDPIALVFISTNSASRYYPPRGIHDVLPATVDIAQRMEAIGPVNNPERRTIWTAPYADAAGQGQIVTARTPVYDGDTFRGSLEVDLSMARLIDTVDGVRATERGFAFYVDTHGDLLRSGAFDLLDREAPVNPELAAILDSMRRPDRTAGVRVEQLPLGDEEYFVAYAPLPSLGGSFGVAAPVSDITARSAAITAGIDNEGRRTVAFILTTMLLLFAAALVGAALLNRRTILRPIEEIVRGTHAIAAGNLNTRIPVRSTDELGMLADSFNRMTIEVQDARESLEQRVEERTRELSALLSVSQSVASKIELGPLLAALVEQVGNVIDYYGVSVLMRKGDELVLLDVDSNIGGTVADPYTGVSFPARGAIWEAMERGEAIAIANVWDETDVWARHYRNVMSDDPEFRAGVVSWLSVPLASQDQLVGSLTIASSTPGYFTPERTQLIRGMANQAAVAVESARLFEETEARTRELTTLLDVARNVASTLELDPLLQLILEQVRYVAPHDRAGLLIREGDSLRVAASIRPDDEPGPITRPGMTFPLTNTSLLWEQLTRGEPVIIDDIHDDSPMAAAYHAILGPMGARALSLIHSWMAAPILFEGRVIAVIVLSKTEAAFFTRRHAELTTAIGTQAGVAIENARLFAETEARTRELATLLDVSRKVGSTIELEPLLQVVLEQVGYVAPNDRAALLIRHGDVLRVAAAMASAGQPEAIAQVGMTFEMSRVPLIWAELTRGEPAIIDDVRSDDPMAVEYRSLLGPLAERALALIRSWMAAPLMFEGRVIGIVILSRAEVGFFKKHHADLTIAIGTQASVAIENARLFAETEARTRELTTLLDVGRNVASTLELQPLLRLILEQVQSVVPYDRSGMMIREGDELASVAMLARPGLEMLDAQRGIRVPVSQAGLVWGLITQGKPAIIDDIRDDSALAREYRERNAAIIELAYERVGSFMAVPIMLNDEAIGMMMFTQKEAHAYGARHAELATAIGTQAAVAIKNARLFEETQQQTRELTTLLDLSHTVASTLDTEELVELVLDQLKEIIDYTGASVSLVHDGALTIMASRSTQGSSKGARIPVADASLWAQILRLEPVIIDDIRDPAEPLALAYLQTIGDLIDTPGFREIRSWMAVPLAPKDRAIGMLTMSRTEPGYFTARNARLARAMADQAAIAIENARLFEETQRRGREMEALFRADEQLFQSLSLDAVFQALVDVCVDVLGVPKSMVTTMDDAEGHYTIRASRNISEKSLELMTAIRAKTPRRELVELAEPIVNDDVRLRSSEMTPVFEAEGIYSTIDVPIKLTGSLRGVLGIGYTTRQDSTADELRLLQALAERAAVAIDNAELYERAQQVASLEERQKLARELHDSVSQALYGIALGARTARTLLDRDPAKAIEPVDYVLSLAEAGLTEMRALIFELRPESLEMEGLVAAIEKNVAATQARYGIEVTADLCVEPKAPLDVKEAAYRIAQEALHNIVKHAQATRVDIQLTSEDGALTLVVQDNGVGFDSGGAFPGHIGLRSMRERTAKSNGTIEITSTPGSGTCITARLRI